MTTLKIDHDHCIECPMCYVTCQTIELNAVYIQLDSQHKYEIDTEKCKYPKCTACLMYCPSPGSIIEVETGRWMVPPPPDTQRGRKRAKAS
jgi:MinD superfamily P-loop ATPase